MDSPCPLQVPCDNPGFMLPSNQAGIRLFKAFGIQVSLHWTWFLVAYYRFQMGKGSYDQHLWMLAEYVSLFVIVLMHEFGHSLACRSVGGSSDRIILWPFGGIAFVQPPPRPGAFLWSIAAGPLVNVVLWPVLAAVRYFVFQMPGVSSDAMQFIDAVEFINRILLIFNLLPIYPLDGGQIFQSILWFFIGQAKSTLIAAGLGLVVALLCGGYALLKGQIWLGILAIFLVSQSWRSFQWARASLRDEKTERENPVIDI